jgi:hypothetical protein
MSFALGSLDALLFSYLFCGFIAGLVWAALEADVVLGDTASLADREAARRRRTRPLAALGVVHVAFALIALNAAHVRNHDDAAVTPTRAQLRAKFEAFAALIAGSVVFLGALVSVM